MSYSIVKVNDQPNNPLLKEFIIDSASDVATLPTTDVADGSSAYIKDLSKIYLFKSGTWVEAG